jgi:hypothetical protein
MRKGRMSFEWKRDHPDHKIDGNEKGLLKVSWFVFEQFGTLPSWIIVAKAVFDKLVRWADILQYISSFIQRLA